MANRNKPYSTLQLCYNSAAMCEEFDARIIIGDEDTYYSDLSPQMDTYYIDGSLAAGRIELCLRGTWNPVCQDFWTEAEAAVACYQLGFSRHGMHNVRTH